MKKLPYFGNLIAFFFASALIVSCTTEVDWENKFNEIKLDQSLLLPVGETVITLDDILNQVSTLDFLETQGSDIYVNFDDSLQWGINEIPALGNANPTILPIENFFLLPVDNGVRAVELNTEMELGLNTNPEDQRIDKVKAKSAKIGIVVSAENAVIKPSDIKIIFKFVSDRLKFDSDIIDDGISEISFVPNSFDQLEELDLPALTINLPNLASTIPNVMRIEFKAAGTIINPASKVTINFKYTKIEPEVIFGYFNPTLSDLSQEQIVNLSSFISKMPKNGQFKVEPEINFAMESTFGMNLKLNIEKIEAYQSTNPTNMVKASFTDVNGVKSDAKSLDINRVNEYSAPAAKSSHRLSKLPAEGEIDKFFSQTFLPDMLKYKFSVKSNRISKLPTPTEPVDFVAPNQTIKAKLNIKVPLRLNGGSWFELKDTIADLKFDSLLKDDIIQKGTIALKITNKLPVKTTLGVKFYKEDGSEIQNMNVIEDPVIPAPPLKADNSVDYNNATSKLIYLSMNTEQVAKLKLAKKIIYTVRIDSKDDNSPIIFQKENSISIKLGIYAKGGTSFNLN